MDKYDVDEFARSVVVALAHSGKISNAIEAVEQYDAFVENMAVKGNIDPEEDDEDEEYDDDDEDEDEDL